MNNLSKRYHRQVILPGIGITGQEKLVASKVIVIGAGGLGCPVLLYLATAGIGTLGIADPDVVSITNLHRQVLFGDDDIGSLKTLVSKAKLQALNAEVAINLYSVRITNQNVLDIISVYDIVIDCTDNFPARYILSDACALINKPLIFGAISQFEGQVAVFNLQQKNSVPIHYRDLFPTPPSEGEVLNCSEAGVLNVLAGMTGTMMATEAIKLITGIGKPLAGKLLTFNLLSNQQYSIDIYPHQEGRKAMPRNPTDLLNTNYDMTSPSDKFATISKDALMELMDGGDIMITDVRESWELPVVENFPTFNIPLGVIRNHLHEFDKKNIVLFCQSGNRSVMAARILHEVFGKDKNIVSLRNGVSDLL